MSNFANFANFAKSSKFLFLLLFIFSASMKNFAILLFTTALFLFNLFNLFNNSVFSQEISQEISQKNILELSDKQIASLGIKTQKLQKFSQHSIGNFPAKIIVPNSQIRIVNSPVDALVEQLFFASGNIVKKNQVVANIRSPELLTLNREILQTKSAANVANNAKKRANLLYKEGLISKAKLEQAISDADIANALLNERLAYLKLFQNQQNNENIKNGFLSLTSPIDGVIMSKNVEIGQRIDAATMIYTIANLATLNVEIQVPLNVAEKLEENINNYQIAIATKKNGKQQNILGNILTIGQIADSAGKSVIVRGQINNGAEFLTPNQSISVDIVSVNNSANSANSKKNIEFLVENNAIIQNEQKDFIFLYNLNNKKFILTPIQVLQNNGKQSLVEIKIKNANNFQNLQIVSSGASALKAMVLGLGGE